MPKPTPLPRPTDAEHAILQVLWRQGPSTVRAVHEALPHRGTGYTTVLKLMQIMAEKGLVSRNEEQRSHVYAARALEQPTQRGLVADFIDRAFGGSASELVMNALASKPASKAELTQIRALLDDLERRGGK